MPLSVVPGDQRGDAVAEEQSLSPNSTSRKSSVELPSGLRFCQERLEHKYLPINYSHNDISTDENQKEHEHTVVQLPVTMTLYVSAHISQTAAQ